MSADKDLHFTESDKTEAPEMEDLIYSDNIPKIKKSCREMKKGVLQRFFFFLKKDKIDFYRPLKTLCYAGSIS